MRLASADKAKLPGARTASFSSEAVSSASRGCVVLKSPCRAQLSEDYIPVEAKDPTRTDLLADKQPRTATGTPRSTEDHFDRVCLLPDDTKRHQPPIRRKMDACSGDVARRLLLVRLG